MDPKSFVITLRLRPEHVNLLLNKLGACPFVEVAEVIALIKAQGDAAMKTLQEQQANGQVQANATQPPLTN